MEAKKETLVGLDVLRFAAAILVAAYHLGFRAFSDNDYGLNNLIGLDARLPPWWWLSWFSFVGVQIFFVISGFVIAFSSEGTSPFRFVRSRILRLAPGMWICATICFSVALIWQVAAPNTLILLYAKSLLFAPVGPWIAGQIWTLPIEIMFYSAIFLVLLADRFRHVENIAVVLSLVSAGYWIAISWGVEDPAGRISQLVLLQHGAYFGLGMALWVGYRGLATWKSLVALLVSVAVAYVQLQATTLAEDPGYGLNQWSVVPFFVWLGSIGFLWVTLVANARIISLVRQSLPAIRLAGLITYPFYLLHYHVGGLAMEVFVGVGIGPTIALLGAVVISLAASYLVAAIVEPAIRLPLARVFDFASSALTRRFGAEGKIFAATTKLPD